MEDKKTEERKGYDVLKVSKHGRHIYVSTDYIEGKPLVRWMKFHVTMPRELFFQRVQGLIEDLIHFHGTSGAPYYQFVNPYSVIVGNDEKWYLLDHKSKRQADLMHVMQRRDIRENFLQQDNQYYQRSSALDDIYGLGKTLQFLLSKTETEPKLSKNQERQLSQFISRCLNHHSKTSILNLADLSDQFKKIIPKESKMKNNKKQIIIFAVIVLCLFALVMKVRLTVNHFIKAADESEELTKAMKEVSEEYSEMERTEVEKYIEELQKEVEDAQSHAEDVDKKAEVWQKQVKKMEETSLDTEKKWRYEVAFLLFKEGRYDMAADVFDDFEEKDLGIDRMVETCENLWEYKLTSDPKAINPFFELDKDVPEDFALKGAYCQIKTYEASDKEQYKDKIQERLVECMSSDDWKAWAGESVVKEMESLAAELGIEL